MAIARNSWQPSVTSHMSSPIIIIWLLIWRVWAIHWLIPHCILITLVSRCMETMGSLECISSLPSINAINTVKNWDFLKLMYRKNLIESYLNLLIFFSTKLFKIKAMNFELELCQILPALHFTRRPHNSLWYDLICFLNGISKEICFDY